MVKSSSKLASCEAPSPQPFPWLMFSHGKSNKIQTFYNIKDHLRLKRILPDLSNNSSRIQASSEGWVVITQHLEAPQHEQQQDNDNIDSYSCFLLNLVSMEKLMLPNLTGNLTSVTCILSSSPLKPNCMLVISYGTRDNILLWRPGQETWIDSGYLQVPLSHLTLCNGKIYGLEDSRHSLAVVDILNNNQSHVRILKEDGPESSIGALNFTTYMVESCGDIFLVYLRRTTSTPRRVIAIEVFKMEVNKEEIDWVRSYDLGDRVFFLNQGSNTMSFCAMETTTGGLKEDRNSIYFVNPSHHHTDRCIYRYCLEDNRFYETLPCPDVVHNLKQLCWIMIQ